MATKTVTFHICDRCDRKREGKVGIDIDGGYLSFGPVNGANDEHIGLSAGGKIVPDNTKHADLCEDCRLDLLRWWRNPPIEQDAV